MLPNEPIVPPQASSAPTANMLTSWVEMNDDQPEPASVVQQVPEPQQQQQLSYYMPNLQEQVNNQKPISDRLEDLVDESFFEFGLVEVLLPQGDSLAWHDAYIIDVCKTSVESGSPPNGEAEEKTEDPTTHTCSFVLAVQGEEPQKTLNEAKNIQMCLLQQVRLKLKFDAQTAISDCQMVHVFIEEFKPFIKWLPGKIIITKSDFFVVEVSKPKTLQIPNQALSGFDVVSKNCVRPQSSYFQLDEDNNPFFKFDLSLPHDLLSFIRNDFMWLASYDLHKDFKKCIPQLISVFPDPEKKSLTCIAFFPNNNFDSTFDKQQVVKRSSMLSSMHFNSLKESFALASVVGNFKKNVVVIEKPNEFTLNLPVKKKYVGLSIGKQGINIQKARHMEGILSLELDDDTSMFSIKGVSEEACKAAADVLYFDEQLLKYPVDFIQLFSDPKLIDEIVTISGIIRVELFSQKDVDDEIQLLIVGKPDTFENFKIIFEFQKADQDEINHLKYQLKMLMKQAYGMQSGLPLSSISNNNNSRKDLPRNFADAVKSGAKQ